MSPQITPIVPRNYDGNRYLLNEDDPMDMRDDYYGFGVVGSAHSTWAWQQIVRPALEKSGYPFVEPAFALVQIPGRGVGFVASPPAVPGLVPVASVAAAATAALPPPPPPPPPALLPALPSLSSLSSLPPPLIPTSTPTPTPTTTTTTTMPPPPRPTVPSAPAGGKRPSKFFSSLADNFNISSGPIRQR